MLIFDLNTIGNNLLAVRKKCGLTQAEVAEAAGLSDRTYADIERGTVNMRLETLMRICQALRITPDHILVSKESEPLRPEQLVAQLDICSPKDRETALRILDVFLKSVT